MTPRKAIRLGDIIAIPFDTNGVAVAIILHISKYIRNAVMLGIFREIFPTIEQIDPSHVGESFIWTPNYTGRREITDGAWQILAHRPDLVAHFEIPLLEGV